MRVLAAPKNGQEVDFAFEQYQAQAWYGLLNYGYDFLWWFGQASIKRFFKETFPAVDWLTMSPPHPKERYRLNSAKDLIRVGKNKDGSFRVSIPLSPDANIHTKCVSRWHYSSKEVWLKATEVQRASIMKMVLKHQASSISAEITPLTKEELSTGLMPDMIPSDVPVSEIVGDMAKATRIRMVMRAIDEERLKSIKERVAQTQTSGTEAEKQWDLFSQLFQEHRPMFFVEFDIPVSVAQYISNSDTPLKADLGSFFVNNFQSAAAFGARKWSDMAQSYSSSVANRAFNSAGIQSPLGSKSVGFLKSDKSMHIVPWWIPPSVKPDAVDAMLDKEYTDEKGEWCATNIHDYKDSVLTSRLEKASIIGADWAINRLIQITGSGTLDAVMDLSGIQAPDAVRVASYLGAEIQAAPIETLVAISNQWPGFPSVKIRAPSKEVLEEAKYQHAITNDSPISVKLHAISHIQSHDEAFGATHPVGEARLRLASPQEVIYADVQPQSKIDTLADMHKLCVEVAKYIRSKSPEELLKLHLKVNQLSAIGIAMVVADNYTKVAKAIEAHDKIINKNKELSKIDQINPADIDLSGIPFVSPDVKLMPHQVKGFAALQQDPKNAVLSVDAGGGKTLMYLLDIARHLGNGLRLPLVMAPARLIKNYLNTSWLFGGRVNFVPLTSEAFYDETTWGPERLKALIENAPPNTIFFADFNFLTPRSASFKATDIVTVGAAAYPVHLPTAFLRQFKWGGIWIDESQTLKNLTAGVSNEVASMINSIPIRREASGTYIHDGLHDVVGQFRLFDPAVFGDMNNFKEDFYTDTEGRSAGVIASAASVKVRERMEKHAAVVTLNRKEWAALLPKRKDAFHAVKMTANQSGIYNLILKEQQEALEERLKEDPKFADLVSGVDADDPDSEEAQAKAEALDHMLAFYLQRMEQYLTAPSADPLGGTLHGEDSVSPKLKTVVEICREHLAKKYVGKILIWTQYVESAAKIYEGLPADLKKLAVHYTAARSSEALTEAARPDKMILVGNEQSMNTGEDLQMFSRIIRLETVWNWGTLEQGESRINRPMLNDPRLAENGGHGIFYDWIFCDESADVTKIARMVSKMVSTLKFYNRDSEAFQNIPTPPILKLNRHNLLSRHRYDDKEKGCELHFHAYASLSRLEQEKYDAFLADPKNRHQPFPLKDGGIIKGSAIIEHVPYVPRMTLFKQDEAGLQNLFSYLKEADDNGVAREVSKDWDGVGLRVHTEFGDGTIRRFNRNKHGEKTSVVVNLPNGQYLTCSLLTTFVITNDEVKNTRAALAKSLGMKVVKVKGAEPLGELEAEPEVILEEEPPKQVKPSKKKAKPEPEVIPELKKETPKKGRGPAPIEGAGLNMFVETYNGFLSLCIDSTDDDVKPNWKFLQSLGFIKVPDYVYSKVSNWKQLDKWYDAIDAAGFVIPEEYAEQLEDDIEKWRKGRDLAMFANGLATNQVRKFLLQEKRMLPKGQVTPYVVSHNHEIYLCLNVQVNRKSLVKLRAVTSPGIRWKPMEGEIWKFCKNKADLKATVKALEDHGILANPEEVHEDIKVARIRLPNQKLA